MTGLSSLRLRPDPPNPEPPQPRPLAVYGLALLLGLLGLGLNSIKISVLTEETPEFVFGGAAVLLSFLLLGNRPGLLTGVVAYSGSLLAAFQYHPGLALLMPVYVLEAWATARLNRRVGSLVFASSIYWCGIGWLVDALVYGGALGLSRDYVTLLFLKQVFNGLACAAGAELVLVLPLLRRLPLPRPLPQAVGLHRFVFRRAALVVMLPAVALALLTCRALFERFLELERDRGLGTAREVAAELVHALNHRPEGVRGADVASLDAAYFGEILARRRPTAARITILDGRHRVLASADPELARQGTLPQEVAGRLEMAASGAVFSYFPSPNGSRESRLGIDLRHAALYRLGDPALAVLVDLPAVALHPALLPLAYQILTFLFLTLLLLFGVIASFGRRVSEPLAVLESASREIARGSVPPEVLLTRLADSPIAEIRSLAADFSSMQHALAYRDATTGLPNRQLFSHLLGRTLAKAAGEGREVAVVAIDLDGSRLLQESLGQDGGARLLAEVAHRIAASAGAEDAAGRLGPDVFALARAGAGAAAEAAAAIDALQAGLAPPIRIGGREIFVTASIGASLFPADGRDVETLLANASAAVERVKEQGKDGATLFSPELAGRGRDRLALESDLRRAVERGELSIHYQPVVELARGSIIGMEAFVRWTHPERGPIAPAEFIPVAERSDLIARIDCWVFETAARQLAAWRAESLPPLTLAVNLSSRQFQRPDLVAYLSGVLERLELPASCLAVELTESAAIQHPRRSVEVLSRLRELGVEVCLDDFGTGYSSLSQLQRLPVDVLKLDRSFVAGLTDDPADAAIAGAVLALARSLGLRVVAEGVETREQLDDLRRRGCHSVQGFLLGEPLPAEDFALLVRADLGLPAAAEA